MCEWSDGVDPAESMLFEGELAKEGRAEAQGVDGRANVMTKAGLGELHGPGSAADGCTSLDDLDRATCPGQCDGSGEPVGPGADYDRVITSLQRDILAAASLRSRQVGW